MFDILINIDFGKTPRSVGLLRSHYSYLSFYNENSSQKKEMETSYYAFVGYSREVNEWDFAESDSTELIIIGETYLSKQGSAYLNKISRRLKSSEVMDIIRKDQNSFFQYIKGNYVLLLIDRTKREVMIVNNRFGISPFYYMVIGNSFYASTSLKALRNSCSGRTIIDPVAILQKEIFNFPLNNRTLLYNIHNLTPAEIVTFKGSTIHSGTYWSPESLYSTTLLSEQDALSIGGDLFYEAINIRTQDVAKVNASLTGGFDGRTILSVIQKNPEDMNLYSFGIDGSENISIPAKICDDLGYQYVPIVLDSGYEEVYTKYAQEMVLQSDCLRTIEGANYPYAFNLLRDFSPVVLTGIFGSELLRTFQNVGLMVTQDFVELNNSNNADYKWLNIRERLMKDSYLKRDFIKEHFDEMREDFCNTSWNSIAGLQKDKRFYIFLMKEGLRKYFGGEVHSERIYATNRFPYLDDDFVDFVFQSPFAGVYSNILHPTPSERFRSQYFYAKIMEKYRPELLRYPTDHGFPASYILSKFPLLKISFPYLYHRQKRKRTKYREFKPVEWCELYLASADKKILFESPFTNATLKEHAANRIWKDNFNKFESMISLNFWWNS